MNVSEKSGEQLVKELSEAQQRILELEQSVAEFKHIDEALIESEGQFRAVFKKTMDAILVTDPTGGGRIIAANPAACRMFGYSEDELIGLDREATLDTNATNSKAWMKLTEKVKETAHTVTFIRKDSTRFQGELSRSIFRNRSENLISVVVIRDITQRRRTEDALRESEARYRSLVESSPDGVIVHRNGRFLYANSVALKMYGADTLEQLQTQTVTDLIHTDDRDAIMARIQRALVEHIVPLRETKMMSLDGKVTQVETVGSVIDFEGESAVQIIIRDITERKLAESESKQAEEALRQSEERYLSVLDNSRDVIYRLNMQTGRYEYISQAAQAVVGFSPDELMAQDAETSLAMIHPDDISAMRAAIEHLEKTGYGIMEYRQITKNGDYRWISNNMSLTRDGAGLPLYRNGNIRDITESKRNEEELLRYRDHLEEIVVQRTQELADKNVQLMQAQRMEALGKLAGGIAHDLNNILQPILLNSEMISDKLPAGTQERELLDQIIDVTQLGRNLVKQIKSFGSSLNPILKPIPISQVVHKALTLVKRTLSPNIDFHDHISMNGYLVNADSTQVNQLVLNLCTNAAQAMSPKGGTLDVLLAETEISQATPAIGNDLNPGKYMKLTVNDTGSGINPEIMKDIFDPFFTTRKAEGTGLGLAVVYEVVKNSQSSMLVYSEVGKGTRFEIFFPLYLESPD